MAAAGSGWDMNLSRSSGRYYWQRKDERVPGESSTYDPPLDRNVVRLVGLAPGPRDDQCWKLDQLEASDRSFLWQCGGKVLGVPPSALPPGLEEAFRHIHAVLLSLPQEALASMWNRDLGAFEIMCPMRDPGAPPVAIWKEHGKHTRKGQWTDKALMPNSTIELSYRESSVWKLGGGRRKISSAASPLEGMHLYRLVRDNHFRRTAEVGMAGGLSTLYILQGMLDAFTGSDRPGSASPRSVSPSGHHVLDDSVFAGLPEPPEAVVAASREAAANGYCHVSIDPFQLTQWEGAARSQVYAAGLFPMSAHLMEPSHLAMPALEREFGPGCMDLVFVDGMHLFDYTLVDLFCADRLTRVGGAIVLDDVQHDGVHDCVEFIRRNYPHWELAPGTACGRSALTWTKTKPDLRKWNDHVPFGVGCVKPAAPDSTVSASDSWPSKRARGAD